MNKFEFMHMKTLFGFPTKIHQTSNCSIKLPHPQVELCYYSQWPGGWDSHHGKVIKVLPKKVGQKPGVEANTKENNAVFLRLKVLV